MCKAPRGKYTTLSTSNTKQHKKSCKSCHFVNVMLCYAIDFFFTPNKTKRHYPLIIELSLLLPEAQEIKFSYDRSYLRFSNSRKKRLLSLFPMITIDVT